MPVLERFIPGDHWIIDDISGQKIRIKDAVRDWRGLYMSPENWSEKEKQLTIIPRKENIAVAVARTQAEDLPLQDEPFDAATQAI